MKPLFHPQLVNGPFEDPGVFIDCRFQRRALMFDLGDLRNLAPRKILRLSDVFVSHAHMDHFMGFDWLLRVSLGRAKTVRLYGPPGFIAQVAHRLAGYTWNLVASYEEELNFEVTELAPDGEMRSVWMRCRHAFRREGERRARADAGVLREEDGFRVRAVFLDHKTPCLAFALEEHEHINVWKNRLTELGLPTGPWLQALKQALRRGEPDDYPIHVRWPGGAGAHESVVKLGELRDRVVHIVPGQKIAYVTDAIYDESNAGRIVELVRAADILFIEAPFLDCDAARAAEKFHLTARQAGLLARRAGARAVVPFHFSPMYDDAGDALRHELEQAFRADEAPLAS